MCIARPAYCGVGPKPQPIQNRPEAEKRDREEQTMSPVREPVGKTSRPSNDDDTMAEPTPELERERA